MEKILIVDDDAFLRDMYATKFAESNYDVQVAHTAHQALLKIKETPNFDIVLLDMVMPGMMGLDLIKEIKSLFPDLDICCIVLSNEGQESDIADATAAGAVGYIIKAEAIPSEVVVQVKTLHAKHKSKK